MPDFTAHRHPVLAVPCPACAAAEGRWCLRPCGHMASELHRDRCVQADEALIATHGPDASITRDGEGWIIDPRGRLPLWGDPALASFRA